MPPVAPPTSALTWMELPAVTATVLCGVSVAPLPAVIVTFALVLLMVAPALTVKFSAELFGVLASVSDTLPRSPGRYALGDGKARTPHR